MNGAFAARDFQIEAIDRGTAECHDVNDQRTIERLANVYGFSERRVVEMFERGEQLSTPGFVYRRKS